MEAGQFIWHADGWNYSGLYLTVSHEPEYRPREMDVRFARVVMRAPHVSLAPRLELNCWTWMHFPRFNKAVLKALQYTAKTFGDACWLQGEYGCVVYRSRRQLDDSTCVRF
jgi:hypothetical protein